MPKTVRITHVPLPLADKVDAMASRLDRSRGWIVKQALTAWVDLEEERHQMTLEALADVDVGAVIDQAQIEAWSDRLPSAETLTAPRA